MLFSSMIFSMTSLNKPYCTTTESNTLQGYVTSVMDSEWGYLELSLFYMERRFNIVYSNKWRYRKLFEDIFKYLNIWRYLQLFKDIFNSNMTWFFSPIKSTDTNPGILDDNRRLNAQFLHKLNLKLSFYKIHCSRKNCNLLKKFSFCWSYLPLPFF